MVDLIRMKRINDNENKNFQKKNQNFLDFFSEKLLKNCRTSLYLDLQCPLCIDSGPLCSVVVRCAPLWSVVVRCGPLWYLVGPHFAENLCVVVYFIASYLENCCELSRK